MSDYEIYDKYNDIANAIKADGYEPKYGIDNLVKNVIAYCDYDYTGDECISYVWYSDGWEEFDHEI